MDADCEKARKSNGPSMPPVPKGRPSAAQRAAWLVVVEQLMIEGVATPTAVASRTGLTFHTAKRWMQEVRARWADGYPPSELRARADVAFAAAGDAVSAAWRAYEQAGTTNERLACLRAALAANRQRALICGVGVE